MAAEHVFDDTTLCGLGGGEHFLVSSDGAELATSGGKKARKTGKNAGALERIGNSGPDGLETAPQAQQVANRRFVLSRPLMTEVQPPQGSIRIIDIPVRAKPRFRAEQERSRPHQVLRIVSPVFVNQNAVRLSFEPSAAMNVHLATRAAGHEVACPVDIRGCLCKPFFRCAGRVLRQGDDDVPNVFESASSKRTARHVVRGRGHILMEFVDQPLDRLWRRQEIRSRLTDEPLDLVANRLQPIPIERLMRLDQWRRTVERGVSTVELSSLPVPRRRDRAESAPFRRLRRAT